MSVEKNAVSRIPVMGFDALYGLELIEVSAESATARVAVRDEVRQPYGLVHGGVYVAIAESLASIATAMTVVEDGMTAMGLSNQTSFLRPITEGSINARATRRHAGATTWVWEVDLHSTTRVVSASSPG